MSSHLVTHPIDPTHRVEVGWNIIRGSYFVNIWETQNRYGSPVPFTAAPSIEIGASKSQLLSTLYDLLAISWSVVDWPKEEALVAKLACDPVRECYIAATDEALQDAHADRRVQIAAVLLRSLRDDFHVMLPSASRIMHGCRNDEQQAG